MSRLRISAINYLNTAPLMWDFEHGDAGREFDIRYTVPSLCAEALKAGAADIGIIPVAAYASIPGLRIIPGVSIAAKRPVRSILLISKRPLVEARSIALDTSSRTSIALLQVLLAERFPATERALVSMHPDLDSMLSACDAALLIGDAALVARAPSERHGYKVYDLADEWQRWTGKPFVFAFWAVREAALKADGTLRLERTFQQSRDTGCAHIDEIAEEWSHRLPLPAAELASYLTEAIDYSLDSENIAGLELFYSRAAGCGAIPGKPKLIFL